MALSSSPQEIIDQDEYPLLRISSNWERVRLADIANVQNGFPFKSALFSVEEGFPLIRIRDVGRYNAKHFYTGEYDDEFVVRPHDILVGMDGDFRAARWKGPKALLNQRVCRLELKSEFYDEDFLLICLQPYLDAVNAETSSVTVKHLSSKTILDLPLPLPPLNEQRRTVEKIEALFDEIDKGVESLNAAKASLALYRQSLLKAAFEGRLTADWRTKNADKLEDPETLLARIRSERKFRYQAALEVWEKAVSDWRTNGEIGKKPPKPKKPKEISAEEKNTGAPGWTELPLGLLIDEPTYGTSKKSDYNGGETGVLRIPNIAAGVIDADDLKSANFDESEIDQYRLIEGDVLTIRSNGSLSLVGKPALVRSVDTQFVFAGYLIRLRSIPDSLMPEYLVYVMMAPRVRAQIESNAKSTSGVNNINAKELQQLEVPICTFAEQIEIVRLLDAQLDAVKVLEGEIHAGIKRAEALRQSILKKAFAGELVPQDPKDEPAQKLLERIKVEKAESERTAKRTRKSNPVKKAVARRPTLTDLIKVLEKHKGWVAASKAAMELKVADGATSDEVEVFYRQLKDYLERGLVEVERRGDEDWLRLAEVEVG